MQSNRKKTSAGEEILSKSLLVLDIVFSVPPLRENWL